MGSKILFTAGRVLTFSARPGWNSESVEPMKINANPVLGLSKSIPSLFVGFVLTGIAFPWPARAVDTNSPPSDLPRRIIAKFKPGLAQEIEQALPASLELARPQQTVRGEWFRHHGVKYVRPIYPQLLRQKKEQGVSFARLVDQVRKRFPERSRRAHPVNEPPDLSRTYILEMSDASDPALAAAVERLKADPEVEYAQRELVATAQFTPDDPFYATSGTWGQAYHDLWGLYKIQSGGAWDTSIGQGLVVAVVDTGVDVTHPDLTGNIWTNTAEIPGNGIDDDGNGFVDDVFGYDFVGPSYQNPTPDNNPADVHGHGTHVAGTIAAAGNNALWVVGVAWGAHIMPVRGLDNNGTGTDAELANAVAYAANNGADVINNSYGGSDYSQALKDAMDYAESLGVVIVAAAGNSSSDVKTFFPASYPACIVATATDPNDANASFSNWGDRVDVAAPGVDILSLRGAGTTMGTPVGTNLTRASGTSMAAPHVSGVAALILSQHPEYSPEQVRQALRVSADDVNAAGFDVYTGYGRVNASNALALPPVLEARIQSPSFEQAVTAPVAIQGIAQGPGFDHYTLEYGSGQAPASWTLIQQSTTPVAGGTLGIFDPGSLPEGRCTIRLRALNQAGTIFEDKQGLIVDYVGITNPAASISIDNVHKPGTVVPISGRATGPSFQSYELQWARGANATNGWSTAGVTLTAGGGAPLTNGELGQWETPSIMPPDFYTIRLLVHNAEFTSEDHVMIYLEPDLASTNDPVWLELALLTDNSILPAADASGNIWLQGLAYNPWQYPAPPWAKLWSFSPDLSVVRTQAMVKSGYHQPAIGDFDGLPGDEIVAVENNRLQVFRPDLTSSFLNPVPGSGLAMSQLVIADLDGDGQPEVLGLASLTNASLLHVWTPSGAQLTTNFPVVVPSLNGDNSAFAQNQLLAVDLDGDGKKEILVVQGVGGTNAFSFAAFNWDGTPRAWPATAYPGRFHQFAAGDFDRDGRAEIVFTYSDPSNGNWNRAVLLGPDGAVEPGWPVDLGGIYAGQNDAYIALADMDRDGLDEIVIASKDMLHVLRQDGTPLNSSWPMTSYYYELGALVVADIDGDTYPEILCLRDKTLTIFGEPFIWPYSLGAYDRNAREVKAWCLFGGSGTRPYHHGSVTVGDFNQDGKVEIVVHEPMVGPSGRLESGVVTAFALNAPYEDGDWPMNLHDPQNTAVRMLPPDRTPPVVTITAPADGATVSGFVTLAAAATDNIHLTGVQFLVDGLNVGAEDSMAPFTLNWSTQGFANGSHTVSAVARDASGNQATAPAITVTLSNLPPPNVTITAPTNQQEVAGTIVVSADASAAAGVAGVQFQLDGANLGAEDTNAPFAVTWNTRAVTNGTHSLSAIARDTAGFTNADSVTILVNNDLLAPTVAITSPTNNAVVSGTVTISAEAADNLAVAGVQLQLDGVNFGAEFTAPPYALDWNSLTAPNGGHTWAAVARDAAGNRTTATAYVVVTNDLPPPTVTITAPTNQQEVAGTIMVSADASTEAGVAGVQFQVDGANLGAEDTNAPFTATWNTRTVANGIHTLSAIARNNAGLTNADTVTVTVTNDLIPPTVSFVSPTNGAVLVGGVTLTAVASDNVAVANVYFECDSIYFLGNVTVPPYSVGWNTRQWTNGPHTLRATVLDSSGNRTNCTINVMVTNKLNAPLVAFTSPTNNALVSGTVTVSAEPVDNVSVAGVQFKCGTALIGAEVTNAPFTVAWDTRTVSSGSYTLSAVARDFSGYRTISTIAVVVTNDLSRPGISITAPTNNAQVSGMVTISADASDNVGVVGVQFQVDGTNFGTELTAPPYTIDWDSLTVPNGGHRLWAVARDAAGNSTPTTAWVIVKNPPSVSITSPTNNATVAGVITVSADASSASGIAFLRFRLDGADFGPGLTTPPYALSWDTTTVTNATTHTWTAVAWDTTGNIATSAVVTVKVANVIKVNFQPAAAATYPGYAVDSGAIYGLRANGYSYGWNANNAKNAYDRNSSRSPDQRYDTLVCMQAGGTFSWEIGLPNGNYSVHVVAGDANKYDSIYKINVEDVLTVNATPNTNARWQEGTSTVTVSDGRLTVSNVTGAKNNKLCFLEITPLP